MQRVRRMAESTPSSRERYVDLLRALAISVVLIGHWVISVITHDARGRLTGHSALEWLTWSYPITWLVQVMPLFFLVGGFANAASLRSLHRRGGDATTWLQDRSRRLVRPTTALVVALTAVAALARWAGTAPSFTRYAVWVASIPLWFLSAYLVVILATPLMYRLHRRFGVRVMCVLVVLVALGDVARLAGPSALGLANFLFGWLAIHQIGFFWQDGSLPFTARMWIPLVAGGLAGLLLLTVAGPYPVSMIDVPRQHPHNASPPTLALLAATALQLGLVLSLRDRAERWLRRRRPWQAVVGVNAVILTIFLWHMSAVLLLVGALDALHVLPTPVVATRAWWLWRLPWLAMLLAVLAGLVAVFGPIETRARRRPAAWTARAPALLLRASGAAVPRALLTVGGYMAVMSGLLSDNLAPRRGDYPLGMPLRGLAAYLVGAAVLRLLRPPPGPTRRAAGGPTDTRE